MVAGTQADGSSTPGTLEVVAVPSLYPVADVAVTIGATPNPAPAGPVEFIVRGSQRRADAATGAHLTFEASQPTGNHQHESGCVQVAGPEHDDVHVRHDPGRRRGRRVARRTHVSGTEEGVFGHATVTANATDPDPADNFATIEVLINPI